MYTGGTGYETILCQVTLLWNRISVVFHFASVLLLGTYEWSGYSARTLGKKESGSEYLAWLAVVYM